jgi:chromosome segregation ATPase
MANPDESYASGVSVQTIISMAVLLIMAFGGGWTLFQSQLAGIEREIADAKTAVDLQRASIGHVVDVQAAQIEKIQDTFRADLSNVLVSRNQFEEFQKRFDSLSSRVLVLEAELNQVQKDAAHHPVEQETINAIDSDFGKRIDIIQVEIQDINRQIAAALIIIDNNSTGAPPRRQALPQDPTPVPK